MEAEEGKPLGGEPLCAWVGVGGWRRPSARLIFHKFEKHTRGSRCVNLNFSVAAARPPALAPSKDGTPGLAEAGRGSLENPLSIWRGISNDFFPLPLVLHPRTETPGSFILLEANRRNTRIAETPRTVLLNLR